MSSSSPNLDLAGIKIAQQTEDEAKNNLLLLSSAAKMDEASIKKLLAKEKKNLYNKERQKAIRANLTPKQLEEKRLNSRRRYHLRRLAMTEDQKNAFDERKRVLNRKHYYEVAKPRQKKDRLNASKGKGAAMGSDWAENIERYDGFYEEIGEARLTKSEIDKNLKSLHLREPPIQSDLSPIDAEVINSSDLDLDLHLGPPTESSVSLQNPAILDGNQDAGVLIACRDRLRTLSWEHDKSIRELQSTRWRIIPEEKKTRKQIWYANLSLGKKDAYREKCRDRAARRRRKMADKVALIELMKRKEKSDCTMLARPEEEESGQGAYFNEYCNKEYREIVKSDTEVMLAAKNECIPFATPLTVVKSEQHSIATNDDLSREMRTQDVEDNLIRKRSVPYSIQEGTINCHDPHESDNTGPQDANIFNYKDEPFINRQSMKNLHTSEDVTQSDSKNTDYKSISGEGVDLAIEYRSKRSSAWRKVPEELLSIDQAIYRSMSPKTKEKCLEYAKNYYQRKKEKMTVEEKEQARARKNYLTRMRLEKLSVEDKEAYLRHRRRLYHQAKERKRQVEQHHLILKGNEGQSTQSSQEKSAGRTGEGGDELMKRSELTQLSLGLQGKSDSEEDLQLSLGATNAKYVSQSTNRVVDEEEVMHAARRTNYRTMIDRMENNQREQYLIKRRAQARKRRAAMTEEKNQMEKARDRIRRFNKKQELYALREQELLRLNLGVDGGDKGVSSSSHQNSVNKIPNFDLNLDENQTKEVTLDLVGPEGGKRHQAIRKTKWRPEVPESLKTYSQLEYERLSSDRKQKHREKSRLYQAEKRKQKTEEEREAFNKYLTHQAYRQHVQSIVNEGNIRKAADLQSSSQIIRDECQSIERNAVEYELLLPLNKPCASLDVSLTKNSSELVEVMKSSAQRYEEELEDKRRAYRRRRNAMTQEEIEAYRVSAATSQREAYERRRNDEDFKFMRREYQRRSRERKKNNLLSKLDRPIDSPKEGL